MKWCLALSLATIESPSTRSITALSFGAFCGVIFTPTAHEKALIIPLGIMSTSRVASFQRSLSFKARVDWNTCRST